MTASPPSRVRANRYRTAIARTGLSRPVTLAIQDGLLAAGSTFFDFGCGRGGDVARLASLEVDASGWDPIHAPEAELRASDVVNLGYVVNVIENQQERQQALQSAWHLTRKVLMVSARLEWELENVEARPYGDGWLTGRGTFQKFYGQDELRSWLDATLGVQSIAAAPGIFYVFRDDRDAQGFRARQVRRSGTPRQRVSEALFEAHRDLLEALSAFVNNRGRLPDPGELTEGAALDEQFGSIKSAFAVIRRVTGNDQWNVARSQAERNLLVYLALAAFGGRPRMSDLPEDLQRDVRALFGSYRAAVAEADRLLFAAGQQPELDAAITASPVGKVLPDAFYVHVSALSELPPVLRIYEGCGRVLVGDVEDATIIKLRRSERKVAYMSYPRFDRDPHPALATSLRADLRSFDVKWRDFRDSDNPPILHRKETFVASDDPSYRKFQRLTAQEERAGLLGHPSIGTRAGWEELLAVEGWRLRGHQLVREASILWCK